jgi:hypothetical protein
MGPLQILEAVAGGALVFFVPGFAVAKALFPERRVRGTGGVRWAIELVALGLVLSVALTVTVGYALLVSAPGGFSATWSDPLLEAVLAAITLVAVVAGLLLGAYARVPRLRGPFGEEPGTVGAWELSERLDRLQQDRERLERDLRRVPGTDEAAGARLREALRAVTEEEEALRGRREAEYDL